MRILGWLLLAYAVVGVVFVVVAALVGAPLVGRAERLATSASGTMDAAAAAAATSADAFGGFDASIEQARSSAADAATLTRQTSVTLDGLADAMSLSIFGAQPLLPLAGQFTDSAEQLRQLGDSLEGIGQALDANRSDVAEVGLRMRDLADELAAFQGRVASERESAALPLSWLFYGFLAWQLLPILAAAVAGRWLLSRTGVVVVPAPAPEP
ncbi:MAG TPA: hypothetical protein VF013_00760 [Candidatus Limnocylindria bacterium]